MRLPEFCTVVRSGSLICSAVVIISSLACWACPAFERHKLGSRAPPRWGSVPRRRRSGNRTGTESPPRAFLMLTARCSILGYRGVRKSSWGDRAVGHGLVGWDGVEWWGRGPPFDRFDARLRVHPRRVKRGSSRPASRFIALHTYPAARESSAGEHPEGTTIASIGHLARYAGRASAILCALFSVIPLALIALASIPLAADAQDRDLRDRYPVDWEAIAAESLEYFSTLLRTDTSNPPGNETEAARYLQGILQQEGIEV